MNVRQLRELLESYDDEATVLVVHQPSWPLVETLAGVADAHEAHRVESAENGDEDEDESPVAADGQLVYLVADGHPSEGSPYGPKSAWDVMAQA